MSYLLLSTPACLVVVFAVAVVGKLVGAAAYADFRASVYRLSLVPIALVGPVTVLTVGAEFTVVILLSVPIDMAAVAGLLLALALCVCYLIVVSNAVRDGNRTPCRCFGPSQTPLSRQHLVRNAVLVALALGGVIGTLSRHDAHVEAAAAGGAVAAGVYLGMLAVAMDDFLELSAAG